MSHELSILYFICLNNHEQCTHNKKHDIFLIWHIKIENNIRAD